VQAQVSEFLQKLAAIARRQEELADHLQPEGLYPKRQLAPHPIDRS
jgi:hypothetical protein